LKEEALDRTQWRTRFGSGYGPVVRQTAEWMKVLCLISDTSDTVVTSLVALLPLTDL
jgi:hypothetical protein